MTKDFLVKGIRYESPLLNPNMIGKHGQAHGSPDWLKGDMPPAVALQMHAPRLGPAWELEMG